MRFTEFLRETAPQAVSLDHLLDVIKEHGQKALSTIETPIFRGDSDGSPTPKVCTHPLNRAPRDSLPGFNFMFNAGFELAFDVPDVRKHAVFASGDFAQASQYGDVYFMVPLGHFSFAWSKEIHDSYDDEQKFYTSLIKELDAPSGSLLQLKELFSELSGTKSLTPGRWVSNPREAENLTWDAAEATAGRQGQDFRIPLDGFYDKLTHAMAQVFKSFYRTDNINSAVQSSNEIIFYHTDGYAMCPLNEMHRAVGAPFGTSIDDVWTAMCDKLGVH